jgi:threonine efflux protein
MPPALAWSIDWTTVTTFALLWAAVVPTPGANSLLVTHVALTRGPSQVALAIAGNMLGILLLGTAALLGMALLLELFPWLRFAVHVLGGLYLVYFGLRLIIASSRRRRDAAVDAGTPDQPADPTAGRMLALGFFTAVSNAQAVVFITSLLAVAGVLKASLATGLVCVAVILVCNASYLAFLGWVFQRAPARRFYTRFRSALEAMFGAIFIGLGGRLLWTEIGPRLLRRAFVQTP